MMKNLITKNRQQQHIKQQHGAVLVMSLLMLFVLTLIGVSSISTTTMEEKMSGNSRNRHLALQAAETAISDAERFIKDNVNNPVAQFTNLGTNGLYNLGYGPTTTDATDKTWWPGANKRTYGAAIQDLSAAPEYTIEYLGETTEESASDGNILGGEEGAGSGGSIHTFRITVRGTGLTTNSAVVIQSHFGKRI